MVADVEERLPIENMMNVRAKATGFIFSGSTIRHSSIQRTTNSMQHMIL